MVDWGTIGIELCLEVNKVNRAASLILPLQQQQQTIYALAVKYLTLQIAGKIVVSGQNK